MMEAGQKIREKTHERKKMDDKQNEKIGEINIKKREQ